MSAIPTFDQLTTAAGILSDQAGTGVTVMSFIGEMNADTLRLTITGTFDGINVETFAVLIDELGVPFDQINA